MNQVAVGLNTGALPRDVAHSRVQGVRAHSRNMIKRPLGDTAADHSDLYCTISAFEGLCLLLSVGGGDFRTLKFRW